MAGKSDDERLAEAEALDRAYAEADAYDRARWQPCEDCDNPEWCARMCDCTAAREEAEWLSRAGLNRGQP